MNPAGPLLLSVISYLLWLSRGFDPAPSACSALASGVLYGSFSLKDLFPTVSTGCSWTLENPDPTKYSLYLKFNWEEQVCTHYSPMVLPLDHYLSNDTCSQPEVTAPPREGEEEEEEEGDVRLELCQGGGPFAFFHFDKNFVQLCLAEEPEAATRLLPPEAVEFRFVEVLLINNNNSSQFTCSVLCRWLEECLRLGTGQPCGLSQTGCVCQPPQPLPPPPQLNQTLSNALTPPAPSGSSSSSECCVTELHSGNANDVYSPAIKYGKWLGAWDGWGLTANVARGGLWVVSWGPLWDNLI